MKINLRKIKSLFKRIIFGTIMFFCLVSYTQAIDDAILAIVEDEVITLQDLRDYIRSTYISLSAKGLAQESLNEVMLDLEINGLNKLIEDKLIINEGKREQLRVVDDAVDKRVAEIIARYPSEQVFIDALVQNGATLTDLKNKIKDELMIKHMIDRAVRSKIYINPKEVTEAYKENIEQFKKNERADLASIFVPFNNDKQQARQKINEALKLIQDGKDFLEVAQEYSSTPSIGIVEKGQILPLIENTVFSLELSETSGIVEVENGLYIFKLKKKFPSEMYSLEEVNETIYNRIFQTKFRKKFLEWLEELKKNAYIEIKK